MSPGERQARDWTGYRVGLTGGIASGKSTVAGMFAALGVPVIDTDRIARDIVAPGSPALQRLAAEFGPGILRPDGTLDRRRLRERVFADPAERQRLERILHPLILAQAETMAEAAAGPYRLLVVPLLFESGFDSRVDRLLVVDAPDHLQRQRLADRDAESAAGVERLLAAQLPRTERLARSDDIIDNSGDMAAARQQVAALHAKYLTLAAAIPG